MTQCVAWRNDGRMILAGDWGSQIANMVDFGMVDFYISQNIEIDRLQPNVGCFGTELSKMHEIVSDWSSRAEFVTNLPKMLMRIFFNSNKCEKNDNMVRQTQTCICS